jgi:diphthine synthase
MLYLIGLGLNEKSVSMEGQETIGKCARVYLEHYTIDFPYDIKELGLGEEINKLARGDVESNKLIEEAKTEDIALLVYGSPLFATTHISLILDAKKAGVNTKIIYASSIYDAIAETGLQLYKFGKTASMPTWKQDYKPEFIQYVQENQSIKAHSLILVDIGLKIEDALNQLEESIKTNKISAEKIVLCRKLGTKKSSIFYGTISELRKQKIKSPFCFVIPGEMHFLEKEALETYSI